MINPSHIAIVDKEGIGLIPNQYPKAFGNSCDSVAECPFQPNPYNPKPMEVLKWSTMALKRFRSMASVKLPLQLAI
jgi:hypothetical protein